MKIVFLSPPSLYSFVDRNVDGSDKIEFLTPLRSLPSLAWITRDAFAIDTY